jgi:hypothetical protein
MAGATNPGNIGHAWVKALWIDKRAPAGMERAEQYDPRDYDFVRATVADNPIYADDREYHRTLDALPTHLRRAFLEGDWNVFAGQYFDVFDRERHTPRPGEIKMEAWWPRWISIDWGFEHPSAVLWHAAAPDGAVITYREFVQNRLSPRMLAAAIAERCAGERIGATYLSPDAFAQRSADDTIAEQLARGLEMEGLPRPDPADNDRVGGWMLMYEMLREDAWLITQNCDQLIETLPTLTRDEDNIEDVLKCAGDDVADAARYGIKSRAIGFVRHGGRGGILGGRGAAMVDPHSELGRVAARNPALFRATQDPALDATSRAIWMRQLETDARKGAAYGRRGGGIAAPRRWRI